MEEENRTNLPNMQTFNSRIPTSSSLSSLQEANNYNKLMMNNNTQACIFMSPNSKGTGSDDEKRNIGEGHTEKIKVDVEEEEVDEVVGGEKLKRHREEVVGKFKIPENWGHEKQLKEWIDYTTFDAFLAPQRMIITARDALIADGRKARSQRLRIHTS